MFSLANELVVHIFSFVDLKTVLLGIQPACRFFRDITILHEKDMQKHVQKSEKTEGPVAFLDKINETKRFDIFGNQTVRIEISEQCGEDIWSYGEETGTFLRGKKHGLWKKISFFGSQKSQLAYLWDNGNLKIFHNDIGHCQYLMQYEGLALNSLYPVRAFKSNGTPFVCGGKPFLAFENESYDGRVYAHCCAEHQGILPDGLL
ncbi:hypothetical protein [Brazilian marseillevirus]|uniref:hypothetical protein n=1 Tax=Brazilian marseillevirus TaxID=1813599 RepID=UPI00078593B7|nr:hypothetical protein A3303_gp118 [Brazilian marseillevirus]AMQ10626.1 hypothetical protein [Brazilian marseillevirus]